MAKRSNSGSSGGGAVDSSIAKLRLHALSFVGMVVALRAAPYAAHAVQKAFAKSQ